jgi:hypothetical protein
MIASGVEQVPDRRAVRGGVGRLTRAPRPRSVPGGTEVSLVLLGCERGDQFFTRAYADLVEDRLEVVVDGVRGEEQPLRNRLRVAAVE